MNECPADPTPVESIDPLENGLRILARIIARDIAAKRVAAVQEFKNAEAKENLSGV